MKRADLLTQLDELDAQLVGALADNQGVTLARSRERNARAVDELLECLETSTWKFGKSWMGWHCETVDAEHDCLLERCYSEIRKGGLYWDTNHQRADREHDYVERHTFEVFTAYCVPITQMNRSVVDERIALGLPMF